MGNFGLSHAIIYALCVIVLRQIDVAYTGRPQTGKGIVIMTVGMFFLEWAVTSSLLTGLFSAGFAAFVSSMFYLAYKNRKTDEAATAEDTEKTELTSQQKKKAGL